MNKPALHGGTPVRDSFLPYAQPCIEQDDIEAVTSALSGPVLSMGETVKQFEQSFARYIGVKYALAVSSASAGLHIALMAAGVGPQEEVITTSLTHPATSNCILYQRAVPIFTDISTETYNLDPQEIRYRISSRTKAIIVSHYAGLPCPMEEIMEIAREHNLAVIEDAAQALGARYRGRMLGALSELTIFSFSNPQSLNTGEGGMVATNSPELYDWLTMFRNNGIVTDKEKLTQYPGPWHFEMQDLGYNYRMTEMQAALGLTQLAKADKFLARRTEIAQAYNQAFSSREEMTVPWAPPDTKPSWNIYPLRLRMDRIKGSRLDIFNAIRAENIGVDVQYLPVFLQPYYLWIGHPDVCSLEGSLCPKAEEVYESIICLPIYPQMNHQDVHDVITAVYKVLDFYRK